MSNLAASPSKRTLYAGGSNAKGQLASLNTEDQHTFQPAHFDLSSIGLTTEPTISNNVSGSVSKIAAGANHTLLLLQTGQVWACGEGSKGQLGPSSGSSPLRTSFQRLRGYWEDNKKARDIAAGWETSYIVVRARTEDADDEIWSMGSDDFGMLGLGPKCQSSSGRVNIRDAIPGHLLSNGPIHLEMIKAGPRNVYIVLRLAGTSDGSKWTQVLLGWGAIRQGQLQFFGHHQKPITHTFTSSPTIIDTSHLSLEPDESIIGLEVGQAHAVLQTSIGRIFGLGSNKKGQLDVIMSLNPAECIPKAIGCTWNSSFVAYATKDESSSLRASGSNTHGQLGIFGDTGGRSISDDSRIKLEQMICGSEHTLLLTSDASNTQTLFGWGWNEHGNLGLGEESSGVNQTPEDRHEPVEIPLGELGHVRRVTGLWAGCGTSWFLLETA